VRSPTDTVLSVVFRATISGVRVTGSGQLRRYDRLGTGHSVESNTPKVCRVRQGEVMTNFVEKLGYSVAIKYPPNGNAIENCRGSACQTNVETAWPVCALNRYPLRTQQPVSCLTPYDFRA
jgi:hypothetical protein